MPRPFSLRSPSHCGICLALVGSLATSAGRAESPREGEESRSEALAQEARERADRLRKAGREDLARLADDLAELRQAVAIEVGQAVAAEGAARAAEEAQAKGIERLDRARAGRDERRQRLARLADQLQQAERELEVPPVVSMPKVRKSVPPHRPVSGAPAGPRRAKAGGS